jgi:hypothetical protein
MEERRSHELSERQVRHLVESGRLTEEEAAQLRAADEATRQAVLTEIRSGHAAERLAGAVDAGLIDEASAGALTDQVRAGGHDPKLRRHINDLARRARAAGDEA